MKKILLVAVLAVIAFTSCSKTDDTEEPKSYTLTLRADAKPYNGNLFVLPKRGIISSVYLFPTSSNGIDLMASKSTVPTQRQIKYVDGTYSKTAKYFSKNDTIHVFRNIEKGEYVLWVTCYEYTTNSSSTVITINEDNNNKTEVKYFRFDNIFGGYNYEKWQR